MPTRADTVCSARLLVEGYLWVQVRRSLLLPVWWVLTLVLLLARGGRMFTTALAVEEVKVASSGHGRLLMVVVVVRGLLLCIFLWKGWRWHWPCSSLVVVVADLVFVVTHSHRRCRGLQPVLQPQPYGERWERCCQDSGTTGWPGSWLRRSAEV